MRRLLTILAALQGLAAAAQAPANDAGERARITAERSRIEAEFEASQRACYGRFAVNDCIDAARVKRRAGLAELRRQEVSLNDAQRRQRAAERKAEIEARQAKREPDERAEPRPKAEEPSPARQAQPSGKARAERAPAAPKAPASKAAAQPKVQEPVDTEENLRRHNQRVAEAEAHKAQVQQRAAQAKKNVRPLPVPP